MKVNDFATGLINEYEATLNCIHEDCDKNIPARDRLAKFRIDYIPTFARFIPDFFSKNVEAENVRLVYQTLRENEFPGVTKTCVDVYRASEIYHEYVRGMVDFLNEIIECSNTAFSVDEETKFRDLLTKAREKDYDFVKSCFGGDINPPVEENLRDAVKNVEMLIDFNDELTSFKQMSETLAGSINEVDDDNELLCEAITLYIKSVIYYCYNMINSIFDSYDKIYCTITAPAPKPQPKFTLV